MIDVYVWDPNPFNPYGAEVARVISGDQVRVYRFCRKGDKIRSACTANVEVLPTPSAGQASFLKKAQYVIGIFLFFLRAIAKRPLIIVPWINTTLEVVCFRLLLMFGTKIVLVVHNPIPARDDVDKKWGLAQLRRRCSAQVVHSSELASNLEGAGNCYVAAHPGYFAWTQSTAGYNRDAIDTALRSLRSFPREEIVALFMGSIRPDKGFDLLPEISRELTEREGTLLVSVGLVSPPARVVLDSCVNTVVQGDGNSYVSDNQLYAALMFADVLIAPYENVTASGTIMMALSLGKPVVAFSNENLIRFLPEQCLVEPGNVIALVESALRVKDESFLMSDVLARNLDLISKDNWRSILEVIINV
ncbi:glycosyltransferase [Arthrobacter sp. E3]|uniref:glycosyltransferase n=1 Tax=Arthrobacter sp. E3 TaxID=517402 RepID=UPI001A94612A|nr:glycosyltransferase [Arthrobacter sp. E3]